MVSCLPNEILTGIVFIKSPIAFSMFGNFAFLPDTTLPKTISSLFVKHLNTIPHTSSKIILTVTFSFLDKFCTREYTSSSNV